MMLDTLQAARLMDLLEVSTSGNWPSVVHEMIEDRGHTPEEISAAWKELEKLAHMSGSAPEPEDFYQ